MTGRWFSPGPPVFPTNKTDRHDITEILLKVVLITITLTPRNNRVFNIIFFKFLSEFYIIRLIPDVLCLAV
jgi:hypothetical protein